jgi:hypothetical protein
MKTNAASSDQTDEALSATKKTGDDGEGQKKRAQKVARIDEGNQSVTPRVPCVLYWAEEHKAKVLCTIPRGFHNSFPATLKYQILSGTRNEVLSTKTELVSDVSVSAPRPVPSRSREEELELPNDRSVIL